MSASAIIMVGPPGVGKSTWLKNNGLVYYDRLGTIRTWHSKIDNKNYVILSSDEIIEQIAEECNSTYDEVFKDSINIANKMFFSRLKKFTNTNNNMIIDRTNMSIKSRKILLDTFIANDYNISAYVFPVPDKNEWNRRLNSRQGKTIPDTVISGMLSSFQMPTEREGFDEIRVIEE